MKRALMVMVAALLIPSSVLVINVVLLRTKYAPGYTGAGFRSIKPGMGSDMVRTALGEPLVISSNENRMGWYYTVSAGKHQNSYWKMRVVFFTNSVVEAKVEQVTRGWHVREGGWWKLFE